MIMAIIPTKISKTVNIVMQIKAEQFGGWFIFVLTTLNMNEPSVAIVTMAVPFSTPGDVCDYNTSNCSSVPAGGTCQAARGLVGVGIPME